MLAWLILLLLLAVEVAALVWWLRKEYYGVFFNGWAALIYSLVLAGDFIVAWLASTLEQPGGTVGVSSLTLCSVGLVIIVFLGTLFVRWVVAQDMTDLPTSKK